MSIQQFKVNKPFNDTNEDIKTDIQASHFTNQVNTAGGNNGFLDPDAKADTLVGVKINKYEHAFLKKVSNYVDRPQLRVARNCVRYALKQVESGKITMQDLISF